MNKKFVNIPLKRRFIVAISPGFFFADDTEIKWPKKSWEDDAALARALDKMDNGYVAFRRFIYDPETGKRYLDRGWVYFGGKVYNGQDVIDGKTDFDGSDIAKRNIENNHIDKVLWFKESGKMYPLNKTDRFIEM